jgi:hypothetical protein
MSIERDVFYSLIDDIELLAEQSLVKIYGKQYNAKTKSTREEETSTKKAAKGEESTKNSP